MIAVEHLMVKNKLLSKLKKAKDRNNITIFTDYIIQAKEDIKEILDSQISQFLYDNLKDVKINDELYSALLYIDSNNPVIAREQALKFYDEGDIREFVNLIRERKDLLNLNEVKEAFNNIISNSSNDEVVNLLANAGIYMEMPFRNYFSAHHKEKEIRELVEIYKINGSSTDFENIMNICIKENASPDCYSILANYYMGAGKKEKLEQLVHEVLENNIDYKKINLEKYYSYLGNYQKVIELANSVENGDELLADAYYHTGNYEQALRIYKYIYYNINKNAINMVIENSYEIKDFYSVLNYINLLESAGNLDKKLLRYKIESEISLDLYNEAEADFKEYTSKYGDSNEIQELLIKYYHAVDNPEMEYKSALNLIERGEKEPGNYKIVVNYLFRNEEYKELISYIDANNLIDSFKPLYCSSLIYSRRIDEAVSFISGNESMLDSGAVIDAIFAIIRNKENVKKFSVINKSGTLLDLIILYIQGKKIDYIKFINKMKTGNSVSCTYIIAASAGGHGSFNKSYIRNLLGMGQYKSLSSLKDNILSINNGESAEGLSDSIYFLYPLTRTLIVNKRYDDALEVLTSAQAQGNDAFYYYCRAYIEFKKSDLSEAIKHVEAAMSILDNTDFMALRIKIGLVKNENVAAYIRSAVDLGFIDVLSKLDSFVENEQIKVNDEFVTAIEKLDMPDLSVYRLKRYCFDNYKQKLKYSAMALFISGDQKDVIRHYSILKTKNEQIAIDFLEYYKKKCYAGFMILSRYYYSKRIIKKALEYFNLAYIRNNKASKDQLFQDLFAGEPLSNAVSSAMELMNEWFHLILYYYFRKDYENVKKIAKDHYDNKKIVEFLIAHAWETIPLKSFMSDLFFNTHDKIMGELLAERFDSMELYGDEIVILRELIKYYPDENLLYDRLIKSQINNGNTDEALETSYRLFYERKNTSSFNRMVQTSYNLRDYSSTVNLFKNNSEFINENNIKYWIYSQIRLFNYTGVRVIMHDYENMLTDNMRAGINSRLGSAYRIKTVIGFTRKVLENEYIENKIWDLDEIRSNVPEYLANDVYEFINGGEPYLYIAPYEYNNESVNIIERLANAGIKNIMDVRIYHIFKVTDSVIKSKNFYIFIKRCIEGYYKEDELSGNWMFIDIENLSFVPGIIEIILKYKIGIMDAVYIVGKIKKGMLN
ncbi:hypothetical protein [Ferroplasma sp.]|uniref:hypothetical protein n=1 Tax=Ferroplasma sp. TaxID=2591003 RepID=UPI00307F4B45